MVSKINDFKKDLAYSCEKSSEVFWDSFYHKAFPDMLFAREVPDNCQGQKFGIDRVVYLRSGKTIFIDEKKRRKSYGDILLEYKSNSNAAVNNGWMNKDLLIDYIAYAFIPDKKVYLLDWCNLKRVWFENGSKWFKNALSGVDGFKHVKAQNASYKTLSIAVPIKILINKLMHPIIVDL